MKSRTHEVVQVMAIDFCLLAEALQTSPFHYPKVCLASVRFAKAFVVTACDGSQTEGGHPGEHRNLPLHSCFRQVGDKLLGVDYLAIQAAAIVVVLSCRHLKAYFLASL